MEGDLGAPNASVLGERSLLAGSSWVAAFLCFIILLTTAGNFLLILLIVTQRSLRNTSNYFLVSLFMSDLMVGLVVMPPAMLNQLYGRWVLRGDFCSLWYSFDVMCCSASILNLCLISLDRYLLIICPLKYKLRMTSCRALWLILATWTLAALASFLPIKMGWHELEFEARPPNATSRGEEDQCRLLVSLPYALVASCLTFFLPSAAISFTYCRILLAARKQAVQVASLASNVATAAATAEPSVQESQQRMPLALGGRQGPAAGSPGGRAASAAPVSRAPSQAAPGGEGKRFANKHSKKVLKASLTLGILLGMFFVAWLPFFVANVAQPGSSSDACRPCREAFESKAAVSPGSTSKPKPFESQETVGSPGKNRRGAGPRRERLLILAVSPPRQAVCGCVPAAFFDVLTWLGYCNSTMNPIIYPLFMRDFKRAMGKYLPCCRRPGEPGPSAISLSMRNSNSGPRMATSLKNVLTLQAETDSVDSAAGQVNEHGLLPVGDGPRAPGAHLGNLFDGEPVDGELRCARLGAPVA
ncbi:5-hydroxytryptamine receptor 6 isoform X1 [Apteryx mantelli]|uniref:5-hydroxytryptamine receptor 6 isoform X1 n=1 Tax=Apteryx mantelli TaxID=2696672 RepID=A0ABM4FQU3_9AVES